MDTKQNPGIKLDLLYEPTDESLKDCISPEEIALIVENRLGEEERKKILSHASSCARCSHALAITVELTEKKKSILITFPIRAVAATLLVFFFSIYLFYRLNIVRSVDNPVLKDESPLVVVKQKKSILRRGLKSEIKPALSKDNFLKKRKNKPEPSGIDKIKPEGRGKLQPKKDTKKAEAMKVEEEALLRESDESGKEIVSAPRQKQEKKGFVTFRKVKNRTPGAVAVAADQVPEITAKKEIEFPPNLSGRFRQGEITAYFVLKADGKIENVTVEGSDKIFQKYLIDSLRKWQFKVNRFSPLKFTLMLRFDHSGNWYLKKDSRKKHHPAD